MTYNSTFDRLMSDPKRKQAFDNGYRKFLLAELRIALSRGDDTVVCELLKALTGTNVSPNEMTLNRFFQQLNQLDCGIILKHKRPGKRQGLGQCRDSKTVSQTQCYSRL